VTERVTARLLPARARLRAHPRWRWMALAVVASGMMLSIVNVSIVNVALPEMAHDLGVDVATISWVVTGFLVTQATLLAVAGRAGDLYGRRRVFVAGVVVLSVGSVLCALAPSAPFLVAFRIVQGVGACAMAPTAFAYAAELFSPDERGPALGVMGGVLGLAPVIALSLAGVLVGAAGWRSVFWFTPVMGVLVLAGAALVMSESRVGEARVGADRRFDLPGAALASVGLFALLVALSRGEAWGWAAASTLGTALLGVAALGTFLWHESRTARPMLDLALLRRRSLATANLAGMASAAALFGTLILLPFHLTATAGFGPVELAFAIMPIAGCFVLVAPLAGRYMLRVGSDRIAAAGYAVSAVGAVWMALAATEQSYPGLLPGILGLGVGLALATSAVTTTAIHDVPPGRLGVASALPNISRYTGGALGAAVMGAVLTASLPAPVAAATTRVGPGGRELVAEGFRAATLVAAGFLVLAALAAARMPRLRSAAPPVPGGAAGSGAAGAAPPGAVGASGVAAGPTP
jgi:EmrB/QacA subfamily drug resistance transporter